MNYLGFGLKNQKLISNLKQFSYSNMNKSSSRISAKNSSSALQDRSKTKTTKIMNNFCGSSLNLFSLPCLQPSMYDSKEIDSVSKLNSFIQNKLILIYLKTQNFFFFF